MRAVVVGMLLGALMCLSNLYVVLKVGWSFGVTIASCVLAFALFRLGARLGLVRREFDALENNAMGSVASSAGSMTGGGNLPAMGALLVRTGLRPEPVAMVAWLAVIAMLGVFTAVPIKRQLINLVISDFFVRRPIVAIVIAIVTVIGGVAVAQGLRKT